MLYWRKFKGEEKCATSRGGISPLFSCTPALLGCAGVQLRDYKFASTVAAVPLGYRRLGFAHLEQRELSPIIKGRLVRLSEILIRLGGYLWTPRLSFVARHSQCSVLSEQVWRFSTEIQRIRQKGKRPFDTVYLWLFLPFITKASAIDK